MSALPGAAAARFGGIRRRPLALWAAGAFLAVVVLAALAAPLVAPYPPDRIDLMGSLAPPGPEHWFGADASGRDLLSRVLYGARTSLVGPLVLLALAGAIGVALGLLAAWRGGWADALVSRVTDVMYAFPGLLFVVLLIAVFGDGLVTAVIGLALAFAPTIARYTRSVAQAERAKPYIDAYRVGGVGGFAICVRYLLPNIAPLLLGYLVVLFGECLMSLTTLSYLGFGAQPPSSDWGLMVKEGQDAMLQGVLGPVLVPGGAIACVVVAFNVVGVRLSDRLGRR